MSTNSWKNLPQEPRWTKQRILGVLLRCFLCLLGAGIILFLSLLWKTKEQTQPLQKLLYTTDGLLTETWFVEHVAVPWNQALLSVDLEKLQKCILQFSQIQNVEIQRQFPNTLKIALVERKPCAKIGIKFKGQRKLLLVDSAGYLFNPLCYKKNIIQQLPTLADIQTSLFVKNAIVGFSAISELLNFLQHNAPDILQHTRYISLKHFDPLLEKKWQTVDLKLQARFIIQFPLYSMADGLKKLKAIMHALTPQQRKSLKKINVALTHPTIEFWR